MSDTRRLLSPAAATLLKAADYIEEHAWCQGTIEDSAGRVCLVGALTKVGGWESYATVTDDLSHVLGNTNIVRWNNTPGRTKAEVVAALRGAAFAS